MNNVNENKKRDIELIKHFIKDLSFENPQTINHHNAEYNNNNKIDVNMIYTYSSQNIKYKFDKNNFEITNVYDGTKFSFNLNNSEIDWEKILSGKYKLKDLLSSFPNEKRNNLYNLIEFMIENYLLDFSFNKVENYKEYYNS